MTAPFLVKEGHPLYGVCDVFNGVLVHGNMVDDVMFYGRGAGKLPTGSAVVADMILAAKNIGQTVPVEWNPEVLAPVPSGECINAFFVRMNCSDATGPGRYLRTKYPPYGQRRMMRNSYS